MSTAAGEHDEARQARADRLKERIYLSFVALAVVLTLGTHEVTATEALLTLAVTTLGTLCAVFLADLIAHSVVTEHALTRDVLLRTLYTSFGALTALTVPVLALLVAMLGWWSVQTALLVGAIGLVIALAVIGYTAVRNLPMKWWQRLLAIVGEAGIGLIVVGLKTLAHG